jgi:hypothetical protein
VTAIFAPGPADDLREAEDRLLGAERRDDLGVGIERRAEAPLDPRGDRRAQRRQPVGLRVGRDRLGLDRLGDGAADERRGLLARLARAEVDDLRAARERRRLRPRRGGRTGTSRDR